MWNLRIMWHFLQASFFAIAYSSWQIELPFWQQLTLPPLHSPIARIAMRYVGQNYRMIQDESAKAIFPFVVPKMSHLRPFWRTCGYCKSFMNSNSGETTPWRSGWWSKPFAWEKYLLKPLNFTKEKSSNSDICCAKFQIRHCLLLMLVAPKNSGVGKQNL